MASSRCCMRPAARAGVLGAVLLGCLFSEAAALYPRNTLRGVADLAQQPPHAPLSADGDSTNLHAPRAADAAKVRIADGESTHLSSRRATRDAHERSDVDARLPVRRHYEISWIVAVLALATVTAVFLYWASKAEDEQPGKVTRHASVIDCALKDDEIRLLQTGYSESCLGSILYQTWMFLPLVGYFQMIVFTCDHYLFALHVPDQTWLQLGEPFLLVFVISHAVLFAQAFLGPKTRIYFMTRVPLERATAVLLEDLVVAAYGKLVPVHVERTDAADPESEYRYYEYTCVRYIWSSEHGRFRPSGQEVVTVGEAQDRLARGGLAAPTASRRNSHGPNRIDIEVPSPFASLLSEFTTTIYIFQFSCIWVYMFYSTWNIATVWLLLALVSGSTKAFLVRRNQVHIRDMAATEGAARVLREGKWINISSGKVAFGDIVSVEPGFVPCDIAILEGCAVVNESMLTGEPMPVQRFGTGRDTLEAAIEEGGQMKRHYLFAGTEVLQASGYEIEGAARAVGVAMSTGARTAKGAMVRMVLFPSPIKFEFFDQLPSVYLIMCMYVVVLFSILCLKDHGHWIITTFSGLCVLTQSLQPNMPVSFTLAQNIAAQRLRSECGIICLSPERLPVAGKVQVMVLDKTGTITKDGMDFAGVHATKVEDSAAFDTFNAFDVEAPSGEWARALRREMLWTLAACHTVTKLEAGKCVGNAVEIAMLQASGWQLSPDGSMVSHPTTGETLRLLKRLEFDHDRMTSGVVVEVGGETHVLLKGSYEKIEALTSPAQPVPTDFKASTEKHASDQYYVLGVGIKALAKGTDVSAMTRDEFERDLMFVGLLLFRNEIKPDSPQAIQELRHGGVRCIMCTGDNALTGLAVGRRCDMLGRDGARVILGDGSTETVLANRVEWKVLPEGSPVPHREVMSMEDGGVDLVLTRAAFKALQESGEMDELVGKTRVYARMKPEDKVAVIELHQARDLIVGMAGDGGNDCGGLRAAHVGLALSEAEASIVAPFSSGAEYGTGYKSLRALPDLLRYGRACLATNLATYSYFMAYAVCLPFAKFVLIFTGLIVMSEWTWLWIDIGIGSIMVALMTSVRPAAELSNLRPTSKLFGARTIIATLVPCLLFVVFLTIGFVVLRRQSFYLPFDAIHIGVPGHEWQKKSDNFDAAVAFFFLGLQLPTIAFTLSFGAEHRKNILTNVGVTGTYIVILLFLLVLLWGGPSELHCAFRVNCDSHTSDGMYIPGMQEFSTGNLGGCFLGPHLMKIHDQLGDEYEVPDDAVNGCNPHPSMNLTESIQVTSGSVSWLGAPVCRGPHNCFDTHFRGIMTVLLASMVIVTCASMKLISMYHPKPKKHFESL